MERKVVMAVDFNNLIYKSLGRHHTATNGMDVGAVVNLLFRLKSLKDQFDPDYIVFASDLSRTKTFRRQLYPMYKAQRAPVQSNVTDQMALASRILALLGFPIINDMYYEGDDILGMISRLAEDHDMNCVIISGDHDMYQLITDYTWIYDVNQNCIMDANNMHQFTGLYPEQWVDYKILLGDNSDNVPGVPNVGKKTAAYLMREYKSLSNIYNNLDRLTPQHQAGLLDTKPRLELLRKLMTIVTDYTKIGLTIERLYRMDPFPIEVYQELNVIGNPALSSMVRFNLLRVGRDRENMVPRTEAIVVPAVNSLDNEYDYNESKGDISDDSV